MSVKDYIERRMREKRVKKTASYNHGQDKWKDYHCPYCQKIVKYIPKEGWDGTLVCPHCGHRFKVPSLDGWLE